VAFLRDGEPNGRVARTTLPPALALLVLAAAGFTALYLGVVGTGPTPVDAAALQQSVQLRGAGRTMFAVVLTNVGSTVSMAVLALLVGVWSYRRGRTADAVLAIGAMASGAVLLRGLKLLFDRQRPPELTRLIGETTESFPSGHATMAMVVIGTLVVLAWAGRGPLGRAVMVAAATLWIGAVGLTRVYLGVHWFTDVLAGWLVGATWLTACAVAWMCWARRGTPVVPRSTSR